MVKLPQHLSVINDAPYGMVPAAVAADDRLCTRHFRVLIALYSFLRNGDDTVWPKREALVERTGLRLQAISQTTTELEALGWIVKVGRGGRSAPARYKLRPPLIEKTVPPVGEGLAPETVPPVGEGLACKTVPPVGDGLEDAPCKTIPPVGDTQRTENKEKKREAKQRRGCRLPHSELPEDWRAFCRQERPDLDPAQTWANFHDYWIAKPGAGGIKLDWLATWRTWVRREKTRTTRSNQPTNSMRF